MKKLSTAWPVAIFLVIVLILIALGYSFFPIWEHKSNAGGQAYGAFLAYVATSITVLVTLVYVYLTREALRVASDSIGLQRKQWEQHLRADPQFWLTKSVDPLGTALILANNGGPTVLFKHELNLYVWNSAEQSFRVTGVELAPQAFIQARWYRPQGFVVKGQHIEKIDAREFNHLLAQLLVDLGCANPIANDIRLAIKIHYRTWEHAEKVTEACYFIIKSGSRLAELTVTEE